MTANGSSAPLYVRLSQTQPIPLDIELTCARGELLGLVGPSGAGKSTILRAIAGLYRPAAGRIACAGETWFCAGSGIQLSPQSRAVGLVFQNYALFPHLSAEANVMAALGHRPRAGRRDVARLLLAKVHLHGLEARRPEQLSGGQQQRVAIARALARDPRVLLLDEPFSAVDRMTRESLKAEIEALKSSLAIPIVLVTHDIDEVFRLADRVAVLHRGRIEQTGATAYVRDNPASHRVAELLGLKR